MTPEHAIKRLIERNQNIVDKSGQSDYTRESDAIINALLAFYHETKETIQSTSFRLTKAEILLKLMGVNNMMNIDLEFLERYLNYDTILTGIQYYFIKSGQKELSDCELDIETIWNAWKNYEKELTFQFDIYQILKSIHNDSIKELFPNLSELIKKELTEEQVIREIKKQIIYNFCDEPTKYN